MRGEALASLASGSVATLAESALAQSTERLLPVLAALSGLLPGGGVARGSVVATGGVAPVMLALALVVEASRAGSWVAVVGMGELGLVAAAELGVDLERLVLIDQPDASRWAPVAATLVEAFDVVLARPRHRVRPGDARRLQARAREQGSALVLVGPSPSDRQVTPSWPETADMTLQATGAVWSGLGEGYGHLRSRQVIVTLSGRRGADRPRRSTLWLPGPNGEIKVVEPVRPTAGEVCVKTSRNRSIPRPLGVRPGRCA